VCAYNDLELVSDQLMLLVHLLWQIVLDIGHVHVVAILIVTTQLKHQSFHVRRNLSLRHIPHHISHPNTYTQQQGWMD